MLFPAADDDSAPVTRFIVVALQRAEPSGQDKTSIALELVDSPGALVRALEPFARSEINLTHIDKRPRDMKPTGEPNSYVFFLDASGHVSNDPKLEAAINEAKAYCRMLVRLGSYPKARRLLRP